MSDEKQKIGFWGQEKVDPATLQAEVRLEQEIADLRAQLAAKEAERKEKHDDWVDICTYAGELEKQLEEDKKAMREWFNSLVARGEIPDGLREDFRAAYPWLKE